MGSVDPSTLRDFIIIAVFIGGFVLQLVKVVRADRNNPPTATTEATLQTEVANLKAVMAAKQDAQLCTSMHKEIERDLQDISKRHSRHEDKISTQIGDVHRRIDAQTSVISKLDGTLSTFMSEIRNWRKTHDTKSDHS